MLQESSYSVSLAFFSMFIATENCFALHRLEDRTSHCNQFSHSLDILCKTKQLPLTSVSFSSLDLPSFFILFYFIFSLLFFLQRSPFHLNSIGSTNVPCTLSWSPTFFYRDLFTVLLPYSIHSGISFFSWLTIPYQIYVYIYIHILSTTMILSATSDLRSYTHRYRLGDSLFFRLYLHSCTSSLSLSLSLFLYL